MTADRERLAQLRLHATLRESDQQNKHHGDLQWLLERLDALGTAITKQDNFANAWMEEDCTWCDWPAGVDGEMHFSDCIYVWAQSVYGDAAVPGEGA